VLFQTDRFATAAKAEISCRFTFPAWYMKMESLFLADKAQSDKAAPVPS
jgi:hypothetical protein